MDLRHRDSMAYLRICSGRFERDALVKTPEAEKPVRLSRSHSMFGGARTTLDSAYPGDIVGVVNPGMFHIGDSVSEKGDIRFPGMPKFPPEVLARIQPKDVMKRKAFEKGMKQFSSEGLILVLKTYGQPESSPLVAAVGPLQFDVLKTRLETEYKVEVILDMLPYKNGAWLLGDARNFRGPSSTMLAEDRDGKVIFLYTSDWERQHALEQNPECELRSFLEGD